MSETTGRVYEWRLGSAIASRLRVGPGRGVFKTNKTNIFYFDQNKLQMTDHNCYLNLDIILFENLL